MESAACRGSGAPNWQAANLGAAPSTNSGGWGIGYNVRQRIDTAIIPIAFTRVRFSVQGGTLEGITISNCYIGIQGAGNNIFAATPVHVTFNGGNFNCAPAATVKQFTDTINLTRTAGQSIVISFFMPNGTTANDTFYVNTNVTGTDSYFFQGADESALLTPSGMTVNGHQCHLVDFQVSP